MIETEIDTFQLNPINIIKKHPRVYIPQANNLYFIDIILFFLKTTFNYSQNRENYKYY